jgi:DNA-directed RNA polymerase omega subunit
LASARTCPLAAAYDDERSVGSHWGRRPGLSAERAPARTALREPSADETMGNRFLLCVVAFRRTQQLKAGAPPRVNESDGHKPAHIAVLEAIADTISWSRA